MATTSYDSIYAFGSTQFHIAPGATLAALFTPMPGQVGPIILQWSSGGTLIDLVGVPYGSTLTAAQLVVASGKARRLSTTADNEILGVGQFYLMCAGATSLVNLTVGLGQGGGVKSYQN